MMLVCAALAPGLCHAEVRFAAAIAKKLWQHGCEDGERSSFGRGALLGAHAELSCRGSYMMGHTCPYSLWQHGPAAALP